MDVHLRAAAAVKTVEGRQRNMQTEQIRREPLGKSKERYLKSILIIKEKYGACRVVDVSRQMEVSKSSASIALKKLEQEGFVVRNDWRVMLTEKGDAVAKKLHEKNLFFTEWFKKIGVSGETAEADACLVEHAVSEETYQKIKEFLMALDE